MAKKQHVGLHRSEEIAIAFLYSDGKTVEEIAQEIGVSDASVGNYIETHCNTVKTNNPKKLHYDSVNKMWSDDEGNFYEGPEVNEDDTAQSIEIKSNVASGVKAKDFFARDKNGRATVMTEGASTMADLTKSRTKRDNSKCIHRISQPR